MTLTDNLKNFVSKYGEISEDKVDFIENDYIIEYTFQDVVTDLLIKYENAKYEIKISNKDNDDEPCLHLILYEKNNIIYGDVSYINANSKYCKIPNHRAGTWMMNLVVDLIDKLDIKVSKLEDASRLKCINNNRYALLSMIRIYEGKRSWYENFGYHLDFPNINLDEQTYNYYINTLINIPMTLIIDEMNKSDYDFPIFHLAQKVLLKYPPEEHETLGVYMFKLWNNDCSSYIDLENFLNMTSYSENHSWSQAHYYINNVIKNLYWKKK